MNYDEIGAGRRLDHGAIAVVDADADADASVGRVGRIERVVEAERRHGRRLRSHAVDRRRWRRRRRLVLLLVVLQSINHSSSVYSRQKKQKLA